MTPATSEEPATVLLLARHGETASNLVGRVQGGGVDLPLNATGRRQAERLAAALRDEPLTAVYASALRRAQETAEPTARLHGLPVHPVPDLGEIGWGALEHRLQTEAAVKAAFHTAYARWAAGDIDHAIEGGESPRIVAARAVPALDRITAAHQGETVFVVAHGRLLRILLAAVLPGYGMHRMDAVTHTNGGLYRLLHRGEVGEGRGYSAVYLDRRDHLLD